MDSQTAENSLGRIEIAPEVLALIAHRTTLSVDGILSMATVPADISIILLRTTRQNVIVLDIVVIMKPHVNIMDTSRHLQTLVAEAIDQLVGIQVEAINVHVVDIQYPQHEHR